MRSAIILSVVLLAVASSSVIAKTTSKERKTTKKPDPQLTNVSVTIATTSGQRRGDNYLSVTVSYSEFEFASNYQQATIAPDVSFLPSTAHVAEIPLNRSISDRTSPCPKSFVLRALSDPSDPVKLYIEEPTPEAWSFVATVDFKFADGTTARGVTRNCALVPPSTFRQCYVRTAE